MAKGLRLAVNSQTPLVRFKDEYVSELGEGPIELSSSPSADHKFTTGGVTRMLLPLLRSWLADGRLQAAEWVAMAAGQRAPRVRHEGVDLAFVGLPPDARQGYALVKEKMWALLNSNPTTAVPHGAEGIPESAWVSFDAYQAASAEALAQAADRMGGIDLLYVHDFQQVGVAEAWGGPRVPKLFHLHTPFPTGLPKEWVDYLLARLHRYDAVIVSTPRYAQNLRGYGLRTPVHVVPPFIDPEDYPEVRPGDVERFRATYGIAEDDEVILNVGRMDPMKGQDRLLRALPKVLAERPRAKLVLVGNGSFSSSRKGGLGLDKGHQWRAGLEALAKDLGVTDRVVFTGHLDEHLIPPAYAACAAFCLPSTREGFGLAAIEAWRQSKPVVVSDRCGVAEMVEDGVSGRVVDCADPGALAAALVGILRAPDLAVSMGEAGRERSDEATLPAGRRALGAIVDRLLEAPRARA